MSNSSGYPEPRPASPMLPSRQPSARQSLGLQAGALRLFRLFGIDVFVHWTWFLVAYIEIQHRARNYSSVVWNVVEYLAIFGIVLLHEFGHALACRQVGGTSNRIVLWPLGGIAFVNPPPRPGALLWSIVAGPLVNVVLLPVTIGVLVLSSVGRLYDTAPDFYHFVWAITWINGVLLAFNLLPIYPLDGGQILQALLWFVIGRARSLMAVAVIGLLAGAGITVAAIATQQWWFVVLAVFAVWRSLVGINAARLLLRALQAPRHEGLACPSCGSAPIKGEFWTCNRCGSRFDTFEQKAVCPGCGAHFAETQCLDCGRRHPIRSWFPVVLLPHPAGPGVSQSE